MKPKKTLIIILLLSALILFLPLVIGFGKSGESTKILDKDYSLLSKKQILGRLSTDFPFPQTLNLQHQDRLFPLSTASFSAQLNQNQIASNLLFRRLHQGLGNYIKAFFSAKQFSLVIAYDPPALDIELQKIADQIDRPFVPSELTLTGRQIGVRTGNLGLQTNLPELRQLIRLALTSYQFSSPLTIPTDSIGSLPSQSQIDSTISLAKNLLDKSLTLKYADQSVNLDNQVLISWLSFDSSCLSDKISAYVDSLATSLKKDPVDAVFKFESNQVTDFRAAENGFTLKTEETKNLLCQQLTKLTTSSEKSLTLDLPLDFIQPKITNSDVNNLGIKELLGRGTSSFRHSSTIRNFNVEKGASIVNRILVAPDEEFSFLENLGEVTLEAGYKKAYVIKKGKTELDVGGGICQVSTTLFRAMLNAGMDITQRHAHAYRVQYYEEDSKPGFDATVFIPSPDLKFKNDTGHYVLIQSQYDGVNKKLTYEIYGTSDDRTVDISNYHQWDAAPAPPDVYIDDPTLPPGKIIKEESKVPGLKTAFDWKVTRQGEVIHQKTFQSVFVPWAAVYRRGVQP
ncbi:hypothetical protein A3K55_02565 [Candidatus Shapirobacteria bacterium RBG_13_44_7]|uniref:YoaR-like putative peptidoglycan binding domain-containing protein n=1 Tax=Candidatus Shapirobacteria bacterium RBG_13_44_7 TaxID=1802149 RepID=A0A1F7SK02_9BACT|nr:MAG: hypothetical protein A3K55_02565 [Candidatus Shapirobacteria bacterium RBG_13_44_7]